MLREAEDDVLVARIRSGDGAALRELYTRYASLVFTAAARVVTAAQAEDVVQEVFLALWRKSESFDPERGSLRSWLVRVAKNRALNELRRVRRREEVGPIALDDTPGEALEPDEVEWAARRRAVIQAAIDALPDAQRRALSLAFFDELSHEQVAAVLGTPLGTTKTRIRSALRRLAPVVAAAIAAIAIAILVVRSERDERALEVVTASDVPSRRLEAAPGVAAEAHGQFRSRSGVATAVLTTTKLPPLAHGETYVAWARHGARWTKLGTIEAGREARALLVVENETLAAAPDEVVVSRETSVGTTPAAIVVAWRN